MQFNCFRSYGSNPESFRSAAKALPRLNRKRLSLIELRLASELRLAQGQRPNPESFRLSAKVLPRLNQKRLSLRATARLGAAAPTRRASGYQPKSCRDLTICGC